MTHVRASTLTQNPAASLPACCSVVSCCTSTGRKRSHLAPSWGEGLAFSTENPHVTQRLTDCRGAVTGHMGERRQPESPPVPPRGGWLFSTSEERISSSLLSPQS